MKTLTIILIASIALTGCVEDQVIDDPFVLDSTNFRVFITHTRSTGAIEQDSSTADFNAFINSETIGKLEVYNTYYSAGWFNPNIEIEDFYFDVNLTFDSDTIYGTGYISQDTVWLQYTYQNLEDTTEYGFVEIHSLYPY